MHRFYCISKNISGDEITISDKTQVHHLKDVLRIKAKDKVIIFDDLGNEYHSVVEKISPKSVMVKIKDKMQSNLHLKKTHITVACAIPKKSKMDDIVDKLTQLGVDRIIPLETTRVIVKLDREKRISRLARWKKIVLNSAKQSQRNNVPILEPIQDIKGVLSKSWGFDLKLIPTLLDRHKSIKEIFANVKPKNVLVLIGPEGDFTPEEINLAKNSGCKTVSLGNLVLRVETAAVAVVSFIRFYLNSTS